jgi:hypothetical protein
MFLAGLEMIALVPWRSFLLGEYFFLTQSFIVLYGKLFPST